VHHTLQEQQLYSYQIQSVQELVPHDAAARRAFCQLILQQLVRDPMFPAEVLFTDELCFPRTGITTIHREHVSSDENPHAI
jgi:hypothetical protein